MKNEDFDVTNAWEGMEATQAYKALEGDTLRTENLTEDADGHFLYSDGSLWNENTNELYADATDALGDYVSEVGIENIGENDSLYPIIKIAYSLD